MAEPVISVVMVDGGFRESFHALDYLGRQTLPDENYEILWVDYTDRVAPEVAARDDVRTFCLDRSDEPQRLGMAYNKGILEARGEILVIPDGDIACDAELLEMVRREHEDCDDLVLYVLRLDQPEHHAREDQDMDYLKDTCSIKHTYNFGGCTTVRRRWMLEMNGYEQLPFFAGYHYLGGDNYIRFKNRGLKVKWHPELRVYHPWHPLPPREKFDTVPQMERFIKLRAATWDWMAYDGLDPEKNRPYDPEEDLPGEWPRVHTEYGPLVRSGARESALMRALKFFPRHGLVGGVGRLARKLLGRERR